MVELNTYLGALKLEVPRILEESREAWADVDGGAWEAAERERTSAATDALCAAARTVFDGTMRVADLEDAWRATYEEYLGVTPADAREGVLQDVHWASGYVGYFPSYVLGDMYTAQIFDALLADVPDALARLGEGDPSGVCGWLREHVWRYGQTYTAPETLRLATGADQDVDHYLAHLRRRFCRRVRGGAAGAEAGGVPRR